MNQADRHNRVALEVVTMIVSDTIANGGDGCDSFFLLESVCVGCLAVLGRPGTEDVMVDRLATDIKQRLGEKRLLKTRLAACETVGAA